MRGGKAFENNSEEKGHVEIVIVDDDDEGDDRKGGGATGPQQGTKRQTAPRPGFSCPHLWGALPLPAPGAL